MTAAPDETRPFVPGEFAIDEDRPMKIIVVGAGFSGIIAGIRFSQKLSNTQLTIYDKNPGVGGTWYSSKYPGLSCDSPAHCYQMTFEENKSWSSFYAPFHEIQSYLQSVVDKYKLMRYIKLQHEITSAKFDEVRGKWTVKIRKPVASVSNEPNTDTKHDQEYEEFEDEADVLFLGLGLISRWAWPNIEGLDKFKGKLVHTAEWNLDSETVNGKSKQLADKNVGVIGVGSSAVQLVPAIQAHAKHVYNFVRGKSWMTSPFGSTKVKEILGRELHNYDLDGHKFTEEEKIRFNDPEFYKKYRREMENELLSYQSLMMKDSPIQKAVRQLLTEDMKQRLAKKPWIMNHLLPDFAVGCRRPTPALGYLEALCEDNVDFIPGQIQRVTETGIVTAEGKHIDLDVLICATGYDTSFEIPFPILNHHNFSINDRNTPYPKMYLSLCTYGFPNLFRLLGPNSGIAGSLVVTIERQVDYAVKIIQKMQRERIRMIEVKEKSVHDFDKYIESYFPKTVYSDKCSSAHKTGKDGRIRTLWPGSALHEIRALANPRWEDYNYEYVDEANGNSFYWLGDGTTYNEKYNTGNLAWYLNDEEIDVPPVPN